VEPPILPIGIFTPTDQLVQAFTPDEEKKAEQKEQERGGSTNFCF
jgi:hypothetical protein